METISRKMLLRAMKLKVLLSEAEGNGAVTKLAVRQQRRQNAPTEIKAESSKCYSK